MQLQLLEVLEQIRLMAKDIQSQILLQQHLIHDLVQQLAQVVQELPIILRIQDHARQVHGLIHHHVLVAIHLVRIILQEAHQQDRVLREALIDHQVIQLLPEVLIDHQVVRHQALQEVHIALLHHVVVRLEAHIVPLLQEALIVLLHHVVVHHEVLTVLHLHEAVVLHEVHLQALVVHLAVVVIDRRYIGV